MSAKHKLRGDSRLRLVSKNWKVALGVFVLSLISTALTSVDPLIQKQLFDTLSASSVGSSVVNALNAVLATLHPYMPSRLYEQLFGAVANGWSPLSVIAALLVVMVLLLLVSESVGWFSNYLTWKLRTSIDARLLDVVSTHVYYLSLSYHLRTNIPALQKQIDQAVHSVNDVILDIGLNIVPSLLYMTCTIVFMFSLSTQLSIVALVLAPLPAVIGVFQGQVSVNREDLVNRRWQEIFSRFFETLMLIKTVKSFVLEDRERDRFLSSVNETQVVVRQGVISDSSFKAARNIALASGRFAVLGYGAYLILQHQISLGTWVAFLAYFGALMTPMTNLANLYGSIKKLQLYFGSLYKILDEPMEVADLPNARELTNVQGRVTFKDVEFGYLPDRQVLKGISFDVPPGSTVALVGPSGSGKTTVLDLLPRFYDTQKGTVLVDDIDVRAVNQQSLRRHIGTVLQDTSLFNDSIRANIAISRPDASEEDIVAAAKAAGVDKFVARLSKGYDTNVGDGGKLLSGGERQRVGIARAMLKDPAIYILDEASSSLDSESERLVQESIERLKTSNKTVFIIAHRLSTIRNADIILVMENGKIVARGKHAELLVKSPLYALLVSLQNLAPNEPTETLKKADESAEASLPRPSEEPAQPDEPSAR